MKDLERLSQSTSFISFRSILKKMDERNDGVSEREDPNDMDTVGSLVDKLITVDLKMWHNQEKLYAIRRMTFDEFEARYEGKLDELHETVKRCCDLNVQRSTLMDAIDKLVADVVSGDREAEVRPQHKTY